MIRHREKAPVIAAIAGLWFLLAMTPAMAVDDLSLNVAPGSESVMPGDTVNVTLEVANLSTAINGVQALMHYDDSLLTLLSIVPEDLGLMAPAEGWVEVYQADTNGDVDLAIVINGGDATAPGPVATLVFQAVGEGTTGVTFRADSDPFYTKLTAASDNSTILPNKVDSGSIMSSCDDGLFCNGLEAFIGGSCQQGTPPDCTVLTDQCNDGVCNESTDACEAQPTNEGLACTDSDLCTEDDVCTSGVCGGTAVDCSHLDDACNVGTCNDQTGQCEAQPANEGGSCDNGVFCDGTETCNSGVCDSSGDPCAPCCVTRLTMSVWRPFTWPISRCSMPGSMGRASGVTGTAWIAPPILTASGHLQHQTACAAFQSNPIRAEVSSPQERPQRSLTSPTTFGG